MSLPSSDRAPFWKTLFRSGDFDWAMKMRAGDAAGFFAPQDERLMAERRHWLQERPELSLVTTARGEALVEAAWEMAVGFGQVEPPADGDRSLRALALRWEPDLVFLETGSGTMAAACVCLPSSWDPRHWKGRALHEIHGVVPRLQERIGAHIDRFLERLAPGRAFCRENWSLTRHGELNHHPELQRPPLDEDLVLEEVHLRAEHQLFTGLPGGVMMGIRIETCPLTDLAADPVVWERMRGQMASMPDDVAEYKSLLRGRSALVRAMGEFAPA